MINIKKREMLSHEIDTLGGIDYTETQDEVENIRNRLFRQILNWTIAYGIMVSLMLIIKSAVISPIKYPNVIIEIFGIMVFLPSMIIYGSAISGTKIVVPGACIVHDKALLDDINSARQRAFDKLGGPIIGYVYALIFLLLFLFETSI